MPFKLNPSYLLTFALGVLCGGLILFSANTIISARNVERLPAGFVPGTKITETKLDEHTYMYMPPYTAAVSKNLPAAPLLDHMAARTREQNDDAFVMVAFNPNALCRNLPAQHSDVAVLMRPLSAEANEIVDVPEPRPNNF